jgi:hypothetical protein
VLQESAERGGAGPESGHDQRLAVARRQLANTRVSGERGEKSIS